MVEPTFEERLAAGDTFEPGDDLPEEYLREAQRMVEFHTMSEVIGPVQEFFWVPRAPSLHAKMIFAAKSQDEVGHGQLLLRVCEDLSGRSRADYMEQFLYGAPRFMNTFHYPWDEWIDPAMIAWLSDGAEIDRQATLLKSSWGPYARAMKKIVYEEGFHYRCGHRMIAAMMEGSSEQRRMVQRGLERWWVRILGQFGPPDHLSTHTAVLMKYRLKLKGNEDLRQSWLTRFVPLIRKMGLEIPDDRLAYDEETGRWSYTEPDWEEFKRLFKGGSPVGDNLLRSLREARESNRWILDYLRGEVAAA